MRIPLLVALGCCLASVASAEILGGVVDLTPPKGWSARSSDSSPFPTAQFVPDDGRNAEVLVTLFPAAKADVKDAESLRRFHRLACRPFTEGGADTIKSEPLAGVGTAAYYATFEDPSLFGKPVKRGSYKVATEAVVLLAPRYLVQATIFCDETKSPEIEAGLALVGSAKVVATVQGPNAPALGSESTDNRVRRPGFSVGLHLPGEFRPGKKLNRDPGYFIFVGEGGLNVSGWLDAAKKFPGMRRFWDNEKAGLKKGGFAPQGEAFKQIGDWSAVTYTTPIGTKGTHAHIRACRVVDDTWIDVHLSIGAEEPQWSKLEEALKSIEVERLGAERAGP